jgi:AMP nucleosidase
LIENHGVPVEIGESSEPIPVHFAYRRDINIEALLSNGEKLGNQRPVRDVFDTPDLAAMDDAIANGTLQRYPGTPEPLALFRAARVDYSLHRLFHYTGTDPEHFQNFVIFTNYQFYVDAFGRLGHEHMASGRSGADAFVEPGNVITRNARLAGTSGVIPDRMPQMPAFHLVEPGYRGITMINIGTGPSNARTITDHVAVLRPHAWLMLGHCAGRSNSLRDALAARAEWNNCLSRYCIRPSASYYSPGLYRKPCFLARSHAPVLTSGLQSVAITDIAKL